MLEDKLSECQVSKSGVEEQFLPLDCKAKAHVKGVFVYRHLH